MEEMRQQWRAAFLWISTAKAFLKHHQHHSSQNVDVDKKRAAVWKSQREDKNTENWWARGKEGVRKSKGTYRRFGKGLNRELGVTAVQYSAECPYRILQFWKANTVHLGTTWEDSDGKQWTTTGLVLRNTLIHFHKSNKNPRVIWKLKIGATSAGQPFFTT